MQFAIDHIPVLLHEVIHSLRLSAGDTVIDGTINGGGHARAMGASVGAKGTLLGIDRDCVLIEDLHSHMQEFAAGRVELACGSFGDIEAIAATFGIGVAHGVLMDLGFSSYHVDASGRGFSFLRDEPLDMRYDTQERTARTILNDWGEDEIEWMLRTYGEERFSRRIAQGILEARTVKPIDRTGDLVEIIRRAIPSRYRHGKTHMATKTFQAVRVAVNDEHAEIEKGIAGAVSLLAPRGRLAVITFNSLEDRMVKQAFAGAERQGLLTRITKKPTAPSPEEIRANARARSAKLRVIEKI